MTRILVGMKRRVGWGGGTVFYGSVEYDGGTLSGNLVTSCVFFPFKSHEGITDKSRHTKSFARYLLPPATMITITLTMTVIMTMTMKITITMTITTSDSARGQ